MLRSSRRSTATVLVAFGGYGLHSMLGEPVAARRFVVALPATLLWNALLTYPVFGLVRRSIGTTEGMERSREVELRV